MARAAVAVLCFTIIHGTSMPVLNKHILGNVVSGAPGSKVRLPKYVKISAPYQDINVLTSVNNSFELISIFCNKTNRSEISTFVFAYNDLSKKIFGWDTFNGENLFAKGTPPGGGQSSGSLSEVFYLPCDLKRAGQAFQVSFKIFRDDEYIDIRPVKCDARYFSFCKSLCQNSSLLIQNSRLCRSRHLSFFHGAGSASRFPNGALHIFSLSVSSTSQAARFCPKEDSRCGQNKTKNNAAQGRQSLNSVMVSVRPNAQIAYQTGAIIYFGTLVCLILAVALIGIVVFA